MENTKKFKINDKDLNRIREFSALQFHKETNLSRFTLPEMQMYLTLHGLERFLRSKGVEVCFEVDEPVWVEESPVGDYVGIPDSE